MGRGNGDGWVRIFEVPCYEKHEQGYTVYKVISKVFPCQCPEACTEVTVWKRFSQLRKLHKELESLHAALYLKGTFPTLPKASYFNRFDSAVMEERRQAIRVMLEFVALHPPLFTSASFAKFFEDGDCRSVNPADRLPPPSLSPDPSLTSFTGSEDTSCSAAPAPAAEPAVPPAATCRDTVGQLAALLDPLAPAEGAEQEPSGPSNLELLSEAARPDLLRDLDSAPSMLSRLESLTSEDDFGDLPHLPEVPSDTDGLPSLAGLSLDGPAPSPGHLAGLPSPHGQAAASAETTAAQGDERPAAGGGDQEREWQMPYPPAARADSTDGALPYPLPSAGRSDGDISFPAVPDVDPGMFPSPTPTESDTFPELPAVPTDTDQVPGHKADPSGDIGASLPYPKAVSNPMPTPSVAANQQPAPSVPANQHPSGTEDDSGQYLVAAAGAICLAQQAEALCLWNKAFAHYQQGIGILINGVQGDPSLERRETVRRKTAVYIGRAEQLADLCSQPPSADLGQPLPPDRLSQSCVEGARRLAAFKVTGVEGRLLKVVEVDSGRPFVIKAVEKCARAQDGGAGPTLLPQHVPHMVQLHQLLQTEHAYYLVLHHMPHGLLFDSLPDHGLPAGTSASPEPPRRNSVTETGVSDGSGTTERAGRVDRESETGDVATESIDSGHSSAFREDSDKCEVQYGRDNRVNELKWEQRGGGAKVRHRSDYGGGGRVRGARGDQLPVRVREEQSEGDWTLVDSRALLDDAPSDNIQKQNPAKTGKIPGSEPRANGAGGEPQRAASPGPCSSSGSDDDTAISGSYLQLFEDFAVTQRRSGSVSLARNLSHDPELLFSGSPGVDTAAALTSAQPPSQWPRPASPAPPSDRATEELSGSPSSLVSRAMQLISAVDRTLQQSSRTDTATPALPGGEGGGSAGPDAGGLRRSVCDGARPSTNSSHLAFDVLSTHSEADIAHSAAESIEPFYPISSSDPTNPIGASTVSIDSSSSLSSATIGATSGSSPCPFTSDLDDLSRRISGLGDSPWWSRGGAPADSDRTQEQEVVTEQEYQERVRRWAAQMVVALDALHRQGIVCRDLHPDNLLLSASGGVCLTFFCRLQLCSARPLSRRAVSHLYTAPELTLPANQPAPAADWWSFGALLYRLCGGSSLREAHPAGVHLQTALRLPAAAEPELKHLLTSLLQVRPEDRVGAEGVKRHPYFAGVDWSAL